MNDNDSDDDSDDGDKNYLATKVFARRGTVGVRLMSLLHVARAACRPPAACWPAVVRLPSRVRVRHLLLAKASENKRDKEKEREREREKQLEQRLEATIHFGPDDERSSIE